MLTLSLDAIITERKKSTFLKIAYLYERTAAQRVPDFFCPSRLGDKTHVVSRIQLYLFRHIFRVHSQDELLF